MMSFAVGAISQASVPSKGSVTNDSELYHNLSEVKVAKLGDLNFDHDVARLTALEHQYAGKASVRGRVQAPMQRISKQSYRPLKRSSLKPARRR